MIQSSIRSEDLFARIDGDEFSMIVRNCSVKTAEKKIHQIQVQFSHDHDRRYPRSFSCGIIGVSQVHEGVQLMSLLNQADEKMVQQKKKHKEQFDRMIQEKGFRYPII